jgi:hypothetical protein
MKNTSQALTVEIYFPEPSRNPSSINYIHSLLGFPSNKEQKILLFNISLGSVQKE